MGRKEKRKEHETDWAFEEDQVNNLNHTMIQQQHPLTRCGSPFPCHSCGFGEGKSGCSSLTEWGWKEVMKREEMREDVKDNFLCWNTLLIAFPFPLSSFIQSIKCCIIHILNIYFNYGMGQNVKRVKASSDTIYSLPYLLMEGERRKWRKRFVVSMFQRRNERR